MRPAKRQSEFQDLGPIALSPSIEVAEPLEPPEPETILVHIGGAVRSPGVYEVKEGQRVYEAVMLAEPLDEADLDQLNLAALVRDTQKILVPKRGDPPLPQETGESSGTPTQSNPLNVNTATQSELERLPGIGPVLAQAILSYRDRHGPFAKAEDLIGVSGIGQKTLERLLPLITIR